MSYQHFFLNNQVISSLDVDSDSFLLDLEKDDLHHAKVLRLSAGEHIGVIDADSVFYECEIINFDDAMRVKITQKKSKQKNFEICLCAGIPKSNKLDEIIRACTEIGVSEFYLTQFSRSVSVLHKDKAQHKIERWDKIAKSAAMQSGQVKIPDILYFDNVSSVAERFKNFDCVFVFWEESSNMKEIYIKCEQLSNKSSFYKIGIVIGPEGGICEEEVEAFKSANDNCCIASLGSSILRTETANVAACSIVKYLLECQN